MRRPKAPQRGQSLPQSLDRDSLWIVTDLEVFGRDGGEAKIGRTQIKVRFPEDLIRLFEVLGSQDQDVIRYRRLLAQALN